MASGSSPGGTTSSDSTVSVGVATTGTSASAGIAAGAAAALAREVEDVVREVALVGGGLDGAGCGAGAGGAWTTGGAAEDGGWSVRTSLAASVVCAANSSGSDS
jgi:hypothetical protein